MQNNQAKEVYAVWILRRDNEPISVLETQNFEEAESAHRELVQRWIAAIKEEIPFELRAPIITAFAPGLIYEITIRPYANPVLSSNPYQQQMQQNGFSSTFSNNARGATNNILDSGYKF